MALYFTRDWNWVLAPYCPSRRTASSLVTDCQSEAVGLIVIINRTGASIWWFRKSPSLPPLKPLKCRCTKGWGQGREICLHSHHPPVLAILTHLYLMMQNLCKMKCQSRIQMQRAKGCMRIGEWKREGDGRDKESPSRASAPLYKGLPNEKGSKGGRFKNCL